MKERVKSIVERLEAQGLIKDMGRSAVMDAEREAAALIIELQSRLESLEKDAARLDWLEIAGATSIELVLDREHDGLMEVSTDDVSGYGKAVREAIDAAMQANKG